jgi:hypothetical protein
MICVYLLLFSYARRSMAFLHRCCILLVLALLPLPARAQTAPLSQPATLGFFGLNTYFTGYERIGRDGDAGVARLVALGREAGAGWAREELSWGNIERAAKGAWDWSVFDRRLLEAAQGGYGIVGMLLTTPQWARVGDCASRIRRYSAAGVVAQDYWCPPANPHDFADYVRATVERYDGDGLSDAPGSPRVAAWQIWNEPNAWETWPGSPAEFGALMLAGYAAAKSADPTAIVASPGLYVFDGSWADASGHSDGLRFLGAALDAVPAAWPAFDALALHPYMPDVAPDQPGILPLVTLWGRVRTAQGWMLEQTTRRGGALRPLWISEIGWSTCAAGQRDCYTARQGGDGGAQTSGRWPIEERPSAVAAGQPSPAGDQSALVGKSEEQQANYLARSHLLALALGVRHLSYFQLEDKFDGSAGNFWEEASIVRTKAEGYAPKPAFSAYQTLARQLAGASLVGYGPLNTFSYNVAAARTPTARYHLRFRSDDNVLVDALWLNAGAQAAALPLEPGRSATVVTRDGAQQTLPATNGAATLALSEQPIYVRQSMPAALDVQPVALDVLAQAGEGPQQLRVSVGNAGSGRFSWIASADAAWLRVDKASDTGWRTALPLTVDPTGLPPGSYAASVSVTSDIGVRQVPVRLRVVDRAWRQWFPQIAAELR